MNTINVVLPTRNEEENIGGIIQEINRAGSIHSPQFSPRIIVVDDSSDKTRELARFYGVSVIAGSGKGLGQAIIDGIGAAEQEIVVVMDADFSHNPHAIPGLIRPILEESYDFVIGSRYVPEGLLVNWELRRRLLSRVGAFIMHLVTGIHDCNSGYFAFRKSILHEPLKPTSWKIMLEILFRGRWGKMIELPIVFSERKAGKSKSSLKVRLWHAWHMTTLILGQWKRKRPCASDPDYEWFCFYRGLPWQRRWKQKIGEAVKLLAGEAGSTFDFGCGSSPVGSMLRGQTSYTINDTNPSKLQYLQERTGAIRSNGVLGSRTGRMDTLREYDTVLAIEVLEHMESTRTVMEALQYLSNITKIGGRVIVATPNFDDWRGRAMDRLYAVFQPNAYAEEHTTKLGLPLLRSLALRANLQYEDHANLMGADLVVSFRK